MAYWLTPSLPDPGRNKRYHTMSVFFGWKAKHLVAEHTENQRADLLSQSRHPDALDQFDRWRPVVNQTNDCLINQNICKGGANVRSEKLIVPADQPLS